MMKAIGVLLSLAFATGAQAQTAKEKYELSAQCRKQAAETFRKDGKGQFPSKRANYENHYNSRLNKCFYIEITNTYERKIGLSRVMRLYDLHENREIGALLSHNSILTRRENSVLLGAREGMQKRKGMASFD